MDINEFFCETCGRLKSKCICRKKTIKQKNLELFERVCRIDWLRKIFETDNEIVYYKRISEFSESSVSIEGLDIDRRLKKALISRGIKKLYDFQVKAFETIRKGRDVVIVAPTGMGKTEAFLIPILERIREGKALIIYPTKALAKDQERKIKHYASFVGAKVVRFDGDSDYIERRLVLSNRADIVLTNPDMVDYHLRNTPEFRRLIENVAFIVFDELHSYTSLLGSNIHWLMKRIERFTEPQIIVSAATIANPKDFAEMLFERKFDLIISKESNRKMHLIMIYGNLYSIAKELALKLRDRKVLFFANSYKSAETITWILKKEGLNVAIHKAGLPKEVRERVEREFRQGYLNLIVSTPTLELGIDVGDVDVVVSEIVSYPQFIQRAGRAGRKGQESLAVLILREEDTISNYYRRHPERYFEDQLFCYVEKDNELIKKHHIISMAREKPLMKGEIKDEIIEKLVKDCLLIDMGDFYISSVTDYHFSLRGIGKSIKILEEDRVIGERNLPIALKELHPGAILIHNGEKYRVLELDMEELTAKVEKFDTIHWTMPLYTSIPVIKRVIETKSDPIDSAYCDVEITMFVDGYVVKDFDEKTVDVRYLEKPISYTFKTKGFVFVCPYPDYLNYEDYYAGSFHALEHILIEASDVLTGSGSQYLGGISTPDGYIFVYDATEGGNGLSRLLFERIEKALEIAKDVLESCDCKRVDGCPKCTFSYRCGNNNKPLNRIGALNVIEKIRKERRKLDTSRYEEYADFVYYP
uniref:DEAD/DEAH box helicase n=1 Tax=Geoglobus ahangari TaxID=113653 RepID=A0A7C4S6N4_9EURY